MLSFSSYKGPFSLLEGLFVTLSLRGVFFAMSFS